VVVIHDEDPGAPDIGWHAIALFRIFLDRQVHGEPETRTLAFFALNMDLSIHEADRLA
jgi:hypothetical protein